MKPSIYLTGDGPLDALAHGLAGAGFLVVSNRFLSGPRHGAPEDGPMALGPQAAAETDLHMLHNANAVVHVCSSAWSPVGPQLGVAVALCRPLVVFGHRCDPYHHLPGVKQASTLSALLDALRALGVRP